MLKSDPKILGRLAEKRPKIFAGSCSRVSLSLKCAHNFSALCSLPAVTPRALCSLPAVPRTLCSLPERALAHNLCFNGLVTQLERALAPQPEQHAKSSPQQAARLPSSQAALNPLSIFPLPCQSPLSISDSLSLSLHRPVPRLCPPTISSSRNRPAILR
jgi:hypothetical protein